MSLMAEETAEAGRAVSRLLAGREQIRAIGARLVAARPRFVVVCGRGSSGHAGTYLRYLAARHTGLVAAAAMPAIASVYARTQNMRGALFVAISQSGRSPDLLRQAEAARQGGALTLALVNDPASPLARASDLVLDLAAGPERSVAATKSVIASVAAGIALLATFTEDRALEAALARLPARLDQAVRLDWTPLAERLARTDRIFTVGRGVGLAVAKEAALKLAEVDGLAGLAYSAAELSHGPVTLAGPDFPVLAFLQEDAARGGSVAMLAELAGRGVPVLAAGAAVAGATALPALVPDHPDLDPLCLLASFYIAAEQAARARGRDPDRPPSLRKVTETL
jgi:glutamine---fructose-6-phosphate transaminase (isomerizing)